MKKISMCSALVFTFMASFGVAESVETVISNKLQGLRVVRQTFLSAESQMQSSIQPTRLSKSGYLVLELTATIDHDALLVFANDFLLLSETSDGFRYSTTAKFIGLPNEPIRTASPKPLAEPEDNIRIENGKARFWLVFYLPFDATPNALHYFGAWPAMFRVPFHFAPAIKAAKSTTSSGTTR